MARIPFRSVILSAGALPPAAALMASRGDISATSSLVLVPNGKRSLRLAEGGRRNGGPTSRPTAASSPLLRPPRGAANLRRPAGDALAAGSPRGPGVRLVARRQALRLRADRSRGAGGGRGSSRRPEHSDRPRRCRARPPSSRAGELGLGGSQELLLLALASQSDTSGRAGGLKYGSRSKRLDVSRLKAAGRRRGSGRLRHLAFKLMSCVGEGTPRLPLRTLSRDQHSPAGLFPLNLLLQERRTRLGSPSHQPKWNCQTSGVPR